MAKINVKQTDVTILKINEDDYISLTDIAKFKSDDPTAVIANWMRNRNTINASGLSKAKIPIPNLAEQERIVGILDKFDALVNDISVGLPAEIQARHKQYEYYRGKRLGFKLLIH
jgi:hypothetical protein